MWSLQEFAAVSSFAARTLQRWPQACEALVASGRLVRDAPPAPPPAGTLEDAERELRRFRQTEALRLSWREITGHAELPASLAELTRLAEICIETALRHCRAALEHRFGRALDAHGRPLGLCVLGMGKLGGGELNFSSDIDLLFVSAGKGQTEGPRRIDAADFFTRLARDLSRCLNRPTADGWVYRVDTRLRPFGSAGALVWTRQAMEIYYQHEGRDWERFALLKARPVAGDRELGERLLASLQPFIFRRYLDYTLFEGIRNVRADIGREAARHSRRDDIKSGPGGIREAEFIVQSLQLLRGGQQAGLRCRGHLQALAACRELGLLESDTADALEEAYRFLRGLENRLQMRDEQQTHVLPAGPEGRAALVALSDYPDWESLAADCSRQREQVRREFEGWFGEPVAADSLWQQLAAGDAEPGLLQRAGEHGFEPPDQVPERLGEWRRRLEQRPLSGAAWRLLEHLLPALLEAAADTDNPDLALQRGLALLDNICRRRAYLSLLVEQPQALARTVALFARSGRIAELITRQPLLLDDLIDPVLSQSLPEQDELRRHLQRPGAARRDTEQMLHDLNRLQQTHLLRIATNELEDSIDAAAAQCYLSRLASFLVEACLDQARRDLGARHSDPGTAFSVIAYGALGAREMHYSSDLDLVFIHSGGEGDERFATRLAQALIHLLSTRGTGGRLYEIDTRLRPNGRSGLLVTAFDAFARYQREQAWDWELRALARARPVAGDTATATAFNGLRRELLTTPRDADQLRRSTREMRERMRRPGRERGGASTPAAIVDIQFIAQYWVLTLAHRHPALTEPTGTASQLAAIAGACPELRAESETLQDSLAQWTRWLHCSELQAADADTEAPPAVTGIWDGVFSDPG